MQTTNLNLHAVSSPRVILAEDQTDFVPSVGSEKRYPWTQHDNWVLESENGPGISCQVSIHGAASPPFIWTPGTWHLYAPGTSYRAGYRNPDLVHHDTWVMFALHGEMPASLLHPFSIFSDPDGALMRLVVSLYQAQESGCIARELNVSGLLLEILALLVTAVHGKGRGTSRSPWKIGEPFSADGNEKNSLLHQVDRIVLRRLHHSPSVPELAGVLCMSESSLAHRFRGETGWTIVERIRWLRIRAARDAFFRVPAPSVKMVAHEFGFRSPQYFARVFRQVMGITPQEYLRLKV